MNLSNYDIIEQHRIWTNSHIIELRCKVTGEYCWVQRGHGFNGQISREKFETIKAQLD